MLVAMKRNPAQTRPQTLLWRCRASRCASASASRISSSARSCFLARSHTCSSVCALCACVRVCVRVGAGLHSQSVYAPRVTREVGHSESLQESDIVLDQICLCSPLNKGYEGKAHLGGGVS